MSSLNVEIKAKYVRTNDLENIINSLGFILDGNYTQVDTYFNVKNGRLKIRQQTPGIDYLVFYNREDKIHPKESNYQITKIHDANELLQIFGEAFGVLVTVKKTREFWQWKNVRVFFDNVEHLGQFVEFEAVCTNEIDIEESYSNVNYLMQMLKIQSSDLIAVSYSDLILNLKPKY